MKHALFLIGLLTMEVFFSSSSKAQEKVIFQTVDYPPYEIENPQNDLLGFDVEVLREAFKRMGIPIQIDFVPWKRALRNAQAGKITGIFSCSARDNYYMSQPISTATDTFFFTKSFNFKKYPIYSFDDLKKYPGLRIGGVASYKTLETLKQKDIPVDISPDDATAFKKLFAGRIDVFVTIKEFGLYTLTHLGLRHMIEFQPLKQKDYHICFSKFWPESDKLRDRFDLILQELREDGTLDAIHDRYR